MKLPPIAVACLSALAIDSCSNIIAQRLKAWNESKPFVFDRVLFFQFAFMVVLTAPVNYHWQNWLERAFPGWKMVKQTRAMGVGEEEKGMMLREDGEDKKVIEEEVRVRNWWNIFRKWFTDVCGTLGHEHDVFSNITIVYHNGRAAESVHVLDSHWTFEGQDRCVNCTGLQKREYKGCNFFHWIKADHHIGALWSHL